VIHLQNIIDAIGQGSIFALIAVGIGLVFGVLRLINFAYGQLIMLAAYTLAFTDSWPDAASVVLAVIVAVAASLVLERVAYLNAGTEGPLPQRAADTVRERIDAELTYGRSGKPYIEGVRGLANDLRDAYARVLGADPADVALTGSTTDGVNTVLGGLSLRPGDEIHKGFRV